ncbi:tryptophan-rich sensory protein [Polaromonas sp.]|uniref:tryptophan-rich sensory protein n=1 Tax=Polaromonas sp. TaxID=1869339 RepID=UPI0035622887
MGCAEAELLRVLGVAALVYSWRARPPAGALLSPYLLLVSFAAVLNFLCGNSIRKFWGKAPSEVNLTRLRSNVQRSAGSCTCQSHARWP